MPEDYTDDHLKEALEAMRRSWGRCDENQWRFKVRGRVTDLRDHTEKVLGLVEKFSKLGILLSSTIRSIMQSRELGRHSPCALFFFHFLYTPTVRFNSNYPFPSLDTSRGDEVNYIFHCTGATALRSSLLLQNGGNPHDPRMELLPLSRAAHRARPRFRRQRVHVAQVLAQLDRARRHVG